MPLKKKKKKHTLPFKIFSSSRVDYIKIHLIFVCAWWETTVNNHAVLPKSKPKETLRQQVLPKYFRSMFFIPDFLKALQSVAVLAWLIAGVSLGALLDRDACRCSVLIKNLSSSNEHKSPYTTHKCCFLMAPDQQVYLIRVELIWGYGPPRNIPVSSLIALSLIIFSMDVPKSVVMR